MNKIDMVDQNNRNKIRKLRTTIIFLLSFFSFQLFSQSERKYTIYISSQFGWTINDYTQKNNFASIGLGGKIFQKKSSKFSPTLDFTIDTFANHPVKYLSIGGESPVSIKAMTNLLIGSSYNSTKKGKLMLVIGPSFSSNSTSFAFKPSISIGNKVMWQIAYLQVVNREKITNKDFSSVNLIVNFKVH